MKEKGSLRQIQAKYEPQPQVCPDYSGKPLGVGSVFTAFGVLFLGAAFALLIFCFERIAQALGVELFIFNTYGVGDQPTECHKHNKPESVATERCEHGLRHLFILRQQ